MRKDLSSLPDCSASLHPVSCFPSFLETCVENEEVSARGQVEASSDWNGA